MCNFVKILTLIYHDYASGAESAIQITISTSTSVCPYFRLFRPFRSFRPCVRKLTSIPAEAGPSETDGQGGQLPPHFYRK